MTPTLHSAGLAPVPRRWQRRKAIAEAVVSIIAGLAFIGLTAGTIVLLNLVL